jgi:hypothetical protein
MTLASEPNRRKGVVVRLRPRRSHAFGYDMKASRCVGHTTRAARLKSGADWRSEQQCLRRAEFFALPNPTLIPGLGLFRCQMLLELPHLRGDHQLAISLGRILGKIVLVIVFCRIEMF